MDEELEQLLAQFSERAREITGEDRADRHPAERPQQSKSQDEKTEIRESPKKGTKSSWARDEPRFLIGDRWLYQSQIGAKPKDQDETTKESK